MTGWLLVAVAVVAVMILVWRTERDARRMVFALAATATLAAFVSLLSGDLERALLWAALIAFGIAGLSRVKFHHSARALIVADAPLLFAGTVPFFFTQYRRMMASVMAGAALLAVAAAAVTFWCAGSVLSLSQSASLIAGGIALSALAYRWNGGLAAFRAAVTEPGSYLSTFAASVADVRSWWRTAPLNPVAMARAPLALIPAVAGRSPVKPDILLIQHESIFDPRLFGLPVTPDVANFLSPPEGSHGGLDVEIFGGGSWQSEFSVMTGIASGLFGTDAYFLFQRGAGRFKHNLPAELARLGYRTSLIASCRRGFLNYGAFYAGMGMDRLIFSDDLPPPFVVDAFERTHSDAQFLPAALQIVARAAAGAVGPQFHAILTNSNHGPHDRRLAPAQFEPQRAFALQSAGDAEYAEYYARLAETAQAWAEAKPRFFAGASARPTLIVHYGDHQPVLARRIEASLGLAPEAGRTFRTFYAVETVNFDLCAAMPAALPIAYLGTSVLRASGLPLDDISATRAAMLADAAGRHDAEPALLRTLVDRGLVDLG